MKRTLLLFLAYIIVSLMTAHAQVQGDPTFRGVSSDQPAVQKQSSRLSPDLKSLYEQSVPNTRAPQANAKPSLPGDAMNRYMQIKGDAVVVDITVKTDMNTARAELQKMGLKITGEYGRVISGIFPIKALPQLEAAASVRYAKPAYKPMHQTLPAAAPGASRPTAGKITPVISQGDTVMHTYLARKKFHVDGKGVKVGVMSDSYDNLGGAHTGVLHGELPGPGNPFHYKQPVQVLLDLDSGGTDEGRGMMEIVHDIAPGSPLAFHTADLGQASFAQGIGKLRKAGCDVIVDDIMYFAEPFFQDGIIAQAVDKAKKDGAAYFSAAGNQSIRSYESVFRDSAFFPFDSSFGTAHNFSGPGDPPRYFQPIYIPPGGSIIASFQWDESSFTASGVGCNSDLDIYLLDNTGSIVAAGNSNNILSGDPIEVFGYFNATKNPTFYLVILKFAGPDPSRVKYILYNDALFYLTRPSIPGILSPTLVGHAKAEGAIATGAAFYLNTPAYGVDTPRAEGFSAEGGVANYFDIEGNRIPPLIRKKPEIVCPDGINTSFFGDIIPQLGDTLPHFFGTSAAAPHGAGVAALMIQAEKLGTLTPDEIKGVLQSHTWKMSDQFVPGSPLGVNFNTGWGLIKGDKAIGEVKFPHSFIKDLELTAICSDNPATTRNWKISNPNPFPVKTNWILLGSSQHGNILVQPGDTSFSTAAQYEQGHPVPSLVIIDWRDNFEFPRFELAFSTRAVCGKDIVCDDNSDKHLAEANTLTTGLESKKLPGSVNITEVYPNPSAGVFRLYLSLPGQSPADIDLYSVDGVRLQAKRSVPSYGVIDIDASAYRPGIYLLKVSQGGYTKTLKLIR